MKKNLNKQLYYYWYTTLHKICVFYYTLIVCLKLIKQALLHDLSKYRNDEKRGFFKLIGRFKSCKYGSEEYYQILKEEKEVIDLHYRRNEHHPEWHKNGMNDMNLIQFISMYTDWKASVKKNKGGNWNTSLDICKKRFNINEELFNLLKRQI